MPAKFSIMCNSVSFSFVKVVITHDILWFISIIFSILSFFAIMADAKFSSALNTSVVVCCIFSMLCMIWPNEFAGMAFSLSH